MPLTWSIRWMKTAFLKGCREWLQTKICGKNWRNSAVNGRLNFLGDGQHERLRPFTTWSLKTL